jgi:cytochrome b subunit of formate dehydrogenase
MHALRKRPRLIHHLAGVVFLSTPFIQIRRRPHAKELGALIGLAVIIGLLYLVVLVDGQLQALGWQAPIASLLSTLGGLVLVLALSAFLLTDKGVGKGKNRKQEVVTRVDVGIDRLREEFSVAHLDRSRTLFLRVNADEASAALAWTQAVSRLIGDIVGVALKFFTVMWPWLDKTRIPTGVAFRIARAFGLVLTAYLVVLLSVGALVMLAHLVNSPLSWLGFDAIARIKQWAPAMTLADNLTTANATITNALSAATSIVLVAAAVVLIVSGLVLALFNRAFGHWFLWTALFIEVSVEATPPGRWTLQQIEPRDQSQDWANATGAALTHSMSYEDPRAQSIVAQWMQQRLDEDVGRARCGG